MIQLGLGLGARYAFVGGDAPDIPEGMPSIISLPFDGYVFDAAGGATATVTLSGTGTANAAVQARGASATGNTSWGTTTSDGAGNWAVTIAVPDTQWAPWYSPQARYGTNGAIANSTNTFGCGDVIGFLGQSELAYFFETGSFYNGLTYPGLDAENLTVLMQNDTTSAITTQRVFASDVTTVNQSLIAMANQINHVAGGRKILFMDMNHSGTSRYGLMDDSNSDRNFSYLQTAVDLIRSGGSDVGLVIENWYNSDASSMLNIGTNFAPWYFGQRWGGEAFTLGTTNPDNNINSTAVVDHCLWDITGSDRGLFNTSRTKLAMLGPMPFNDSPTSPDPEFDSFTGTGPRMVEPRRANIEAFTQDARMQQFCVGYGPSTHITDFGGGIHPLPDDEFGTLQFALNHMPAVLAWIGVAADEPVIVDIEADDSGAYADLLVSLPNGGDLTTLRAHAGLGDPAILPPHYQPVVGFEITRAGGARRPVFGLAETSYPAAHRGTVTIQDTGSGDPRIGRVRITPEQPFSTGDQIDYLLGQATAILLEPRDVVADLHKNMLIEHVPALYDSGALYPMRGLAVKPQFGTQGVALPAAPFVARGAAFDGSTNYASNTISIPAGSQGLMSFWFRNRDSAWNALSGRRLCQFRVGSGTRLEVNTAGAGRLQFRLNQNGAGSDVFTVPTNTFTLNQWTHIAWAWDFAQTRFQLYVDGVVLNTSNYSFGTDGFQMAGNDFTRIGIASDVSSNKRWLGDIGHFWLETNDTLDLSVSANLERFISGGAPVDLGQLGEVPTGNVPQYYYDGDGAAWANLGSAGNVPLNGLITVSDLPPGL
ncbi:hypothetical protein [Profundibacter sp.]